MQKTDVNKSQSKLWFPLKLILFSFLGVVSGAPNLMAGVGTAKDANDTCGKVWDRQLSIPSYRFQILDKMGKPLPRLNARVWLNIAQNVWHGDHWLDVGRSIEAQLEFDPVTSTYVSSPILKVNIKPNPTGIFIFCQERVMSFVAQFNEKEGAHPYLKDLRTSKFLIEFENVKTSDLVKQLPDPLKPILITLYPPDEMSPEDQEYSRVRSINVMARKVKPVSEMSSADIIEELVSQTTYLQKDLEKVAFPQTTDVLHDRGIAFLNRICFGLASGSERDIPGLSHALIPVLSRDFHQKIDQLRDPEKNWVEERLLRWPLVCGRAYVAGSSAAPKSEAIDVLTNLISTAAAIENQSLRKDTLRFPITDLIVRLIGKSAQIQGALTSQTVRLKSAHTPKDLMIAQPTKILNEGGGVVVNRLLNTIETSGSFSARDKAAAELIAIVKAN